MRALLHSSTPMYALARALLPKWPPLASGHVHLWCRSAAARHFLAASSTFEARNKARSGTSPVKSRHAPCPCRSVSTAAPGPAQEMSGHRIEVEVDILLEDDELDVTQCALTATRTHPQLCCHISAASSDPCDMHAVCQGGCTCCHGGAACRCQASCRPGTAPARGTGNRCVFPCNTIYRFPCGRSLACLSWRPGANMPAHHITPGSAPTCLSLSKLSQHACNVC